MTQVQPAFTFFHQPKIKTPALPKLSKMSSVASFLAEFVAEDRRDQACEAMSNLFAQLHLTLAKEFFESYKDLAPQELHVTPAPAPAPAPAPKKSQTFPPCSAMTAKGEPCPRKCCAESPDTFCAAHLAQSLKPVPAPAATTEPKKQISKKAARAQVPLCSGKTAKNEACTRKCCAESDIFCAAHLAQSLKPAKASGSAKKAEKKPAGDKPKKEKTAKPVKPVPTHNHALTEEVEANCDLCQTHGNAADPELTTAQFEEISGDLQSRLKSILANLHEVEDEDEEEETEKSLAEEDLEFGEAALESEAEEEEEFEDEEEEIED